MHKQSKGNSLTSIQDKQWTLPTVEKTTEKFGICFLYHKDNQESVTTAFANKFKFIINLLLYKLNVTFYIEL